MDFSSGRRSRTTQREIQKTRGLEMIVLRRIEKKGFEKKTKTRVLRTGYLIKRFDRCERSSGRYCGFASHYWTTHCRTTSIRAPLSVDWPF
jgi:hypothetical protein